MWTRVAITLFLAGWASCISRDQLYPHGGGLDYELQRGFRIASDEVQLKIPVVFYGESYSSLFVNNNGLVSFRTDVSSFINVELPLLSYPSIAAFYTNVDTSSYGTVYYREAQDSHSIAKATESVRDNFAEYDEFLPTSVFVTTWSDVGYTNGASNKVNTFQAAIISNGTESFVELLYPEDGLQWIQAISQGTGRSDAKAQAGFISEDGRYYTLRGSGSDQVRNLVAWSNSFTRGKHIFRVGNIEENVELPQQYTNDVDEEDDMRTCAHKGANVCSINSNCIDYQTGICCKCFEGFYGNGKSCVKNDVPLRVSGKVNGNINDETLTGIDVQAYIVMTEGRIYTALSKVPPNIGDSLQTLNVLGGVMGWLFAKPIGNSKNGYELTGGMFNYTADIVYTDSNERIRVQQQYKGHDVFDQLHVDVEITGRLPSVPPNSKFEIAEYEEQYTLVERGLVLSNSERRFKDKTRNIQYTQSISQSFKFSPCQHAPEAPEDREPKTLKVAKNFLGFESREGIVRYGMSNKIAPLGQEDPCIKGRETCGDKSSCVVENDTFKCVCNPGYQFLYRENQPPICIDINECLTGTHTCDINARCYNNEGSYSCQCNAGYEGNGASCVKVSGCQSTRCDPNASCYEQEGNPICACNEGFTGDGYRCWLVAGTGCEVLQNCAPDANCTYSEYTRTYVCTCLPGFEGDGYDCSLIEYHSSTDSNDGNPDEVKPSCVLGFCVCPSGYDLALDRNGESTCRQFVIPTDVQTTTVREDVYDRTESEADCNSNRDICHPRALCAYIASAGIYRCQCPEGYDGDGYECVERGATCDNCDVHASCIYDSYISRSVCVCDPGYTGDGYICHSRADCLSNHDCEENAECTVNQNSGRYECICKEGYTKDSNDACIPDGGLCNNAKCTEHAVCEWDPQNQVSYCSCESGYEGDGINECLPQGGAGCEVANNCGAYARCDINPITNKYKCQCEDGYFGDGYLCTPENNCRNDPYLCSQFATCLQRERSFVCECNSGYLGNGTTCIPIPKREGNFLLLNQEMGVVRIPFKPTKYDYGRPIQMTYGQMAIALDIDCTGGRVYWSDVLGKVIKSSNYDGSGLEVFLSEDINSPEGISIDWIARNIFWTDSGSDKIQVASIDSRIRRVLVDTGLIEPRGIAVHPARGKVFWSDWNRANPKIEWSNMDGSGREIFINDKSVAALPNSLAIDWTTDSLCYADAGTHKIECAHIDTREINTIAENCSYPFGLAITDTHFYWTDWHTQKIEVLDRRTQQREKSLAVPFGIYKNKLYGMAAVPEECLRLSNACQYHNGNCPSGQLCLLNGAGSRTCL